MTLYISYMKFFTTNQFTRNFWRNISNLRVKTSDLNVLFENGLRHGARMMGLEPKPKPKLAGPGASQTTNPNQPNLKDKAGSVSFRFDPRT
jgi:hypothetical protein